MPTNKLERRFLPAREMRVSRNEAGAQMLAGYAAVFDSLSEDMGGWREKLAPGCFTATLATLPDVRGLVNHDPNLILGRTKSGTLALSQDETGLHFELALPDTQIARDIATSIERGDIDQCSFGMIVDDASFEDAPDGSWVRTVRAASLFDVSVVTYPAYTATSVSLRSLFPDGVPETITAQLEKRSNADGCDCDCKACRAGDCCDCDDPACDDDNCDCDEYYSLRTRLRIAEAS